jgi:hypothetical protein
VPHRFPEVSDRELLSFREVCDALPEAAARHLLVHGIEDLHPVYVRWGAELSPQPAPLTWWLNHTGPGNEVDGTAHLLWMLWHENRFGTHSAAAGHGGPSEPVEVFFDPERVKGFKASKKWTQPVFAGWNVPPEWLAEAGIEWEPKRREHKGKLWRKLVKEATAAKGSQLTREEVQEALRAGGVKVLKTETGYSVGGEHYTAGTFRNAARYAAQKLAKK